MEKDLNDNDSVTLTIRRIDLCNLMYGCAILSAHATDVSEVKWFDWVELHDKLLHIALDNLPKSEVSSIYGIQKRPEA